MSANAPTDDRLDAVLAEYFQRLDRGEVVSPTSLLAAHPDLSEPLGEFFDAAGFIERLAGPTQSEQTQMLSANDTARSVLLGETIVSGVQAVPARLSAKDGSFPQHFGRYEIIRLLGQGAMGAVYLAYDPSLQRQIAMKIPKFTDATSPDMSERFLREARSAAQLRHANICPVYDVGRIDGVHYITMAYIEGRTLAEELRAGRTFQPREIAQITRKLALALGKAHSAGVVHRDLKPGNIMLDPDGEPILMDFGLAYREETDELRLTKSGMIVGSPAYMSPEQIDGDAAKIGPASDIYSLGVVLYEMITGQLPFSGTMMSVIGQIASKEPTPVGHWRPELADSPLARLCQKMLAKRPQQRPQSMQDVAAALDYVLSGLAEPRKDGVTEGQRDGGNSHSHVSAASLHPSLTPSLRPEPTPTPQIQLGSTLAVKFPEAVLAQERRDRARMFLATTLILSALLGLFGALAGVVYVATDQGTLEITSHVDNVQIEVTSDDGVKVLDVDSGTTVHRLRSGDYKLNVAGDQTRVTLDKTGFKVTRGGKVVVEALMKGGTTTTIDEAMTARDEAAAPRSAIQPALTQLVQFEGHESYSLNLDFSPGGQQLVTACGQPDCHVRLWDARNGRLQSEFKAGTRSLHTVTFSPDGKYVATGGKSGEIILLDAKNLTEVRRWKAHDKFVDCLAFSPDSKQLASGSDNWGRPEADVSVRVWEVETGSLVWKQGLPQIVRGRPGGERGGQVFGLAYSPDGAQLVTAHQSPEQQITIWQAGSGTLVRKFGKAAAPVRCTAWSPDGRIIATGHTALNMVGNRWADPENCVVRLYDAATGNELRALRGHTGPLESLDFSPDGKLLVSSSGGQYLNDDFYERESSDNSIRIWDVASGRQLLKHDLATAVKCVRFSRDGTKIASSAGAVGERADVQIWAVPKNLELPIEATLPGPKPFARLTDHSGSVRSVVFEPDGQHFITTGWDHTIRRWRLAERRQVGLIPTNGHAAYRSRLLPDGRLVTCGLDQTVRTWDIVQGRELQASSRQSKPIVGLAITHDGKSALTGNWDGALTHWNLDKLSDSLPIGADAGTVWDIAFSPDETQAAVADFRGPVDLWDVKKGQRLAELGKHEGGALAVAYFGDATKLLSAGRDGKLKQWDVAARTLVREQSFPGVWIESFAISPDGKLALVGLSAMDKVETSDPSAGQCVVFNLETWQEEARLPTGVPCVYATSFSPDGELLLAGGGQHGFTPDSAVCLWRLDEVRKPVAAPVEITTAERLFTGPSSSGFSIAASADGSQALVGHFRGGVSLWDVAQGKEIRKFAGQDKAIHRVLFWPDGQHVLAASEDATIRLWNLETAAEVRQFQGHTGRVNTLDLSRDGSMLLSASADYGQDRDNSVRLWDAATGRELRRFGQPVRYVREVVFSHDGRRAFGTGAGLTSIIEWDVASGEPVHRFEETPTAPLSLAVSPDGSLLAAGYMARQRRRERFDDPENSVVRLWDLNSRSIVRELRGHTGPVGDLAFTPDGRLLLTAATSEHDATDQLVASTDQTVRVWEVSTGREVARYQVQERVIQIAPCPDSQSFLTVGNSVRLWRLPESIQPQLEPGIASGAAAAPTQVAITEVRRLKTPARQTLSVAWMPDCRYAVASSNPGDNAAYVWDANSGELVHRLKGHTGAVMTVAVSSDGTRVLSAGLDNSVRLWDLKSGEELLRLPATDASAAALSPDGRRALIGSRSGKLALWDLDKREAVLQLPGHERWVDVVRFSKDGSRALTGSRDAAIGLWDLTTGRELIRLKGHASDVKDVTFMADETQALSASVDGTVRVWNLADGEQVQQIQVSKAWLYGAVLLPGERQFIAGAIDGTLGLWNVADGSRIAHVDLKPAAGVLGLALSGEQLLTAHADGSARTWLISPKAIVPAGSAPTSKNRP